MKNWRDLFQEQPSQNYEKELFAKAHRELEALSQIKNKKWFWAWLGGIAAGSLGIALWLKNPNPTAVDEEMLAFSDINESDLDLEFFEELEMFEELDELDQEINI